MTNCIFFEGYVQMSITRAKSPFPLLYLLPRKPCRFLSQLQILFKEQKLIFSVFSVIIIKKISMPIWLRPHLNSLIHHCEEVWSILRLLLCPGVSCKDPSSDENVLSFKIQTECLEKSYLCQRELVPLENYKSLSNYMNVSVLQV